jgi:hypothetical protein
VSEYSDTLQTHCRVIAAAGDRADLNIGGNWWFFK